MAASKYEAYKGPQLYVKLKDSPSVFGFGEDTVKKLAVEAGAFRKVSSMALINIKKLQDYLETFEAFC